MAIVTNNGATTLSTAGGFYRVESANLSMSGTTDLALSTTRTFDVTFANAGNCQGVILALLCGNGFIERSVTVVLQENVASVWTDRTSVTYTNAQVLNATNKIANGIIVPFHFGTPYTVTTAASKWRFQVSQGSYVTLSSSWSIRTSNNTNPFYVTWCDNAVNFTNGDVLIVNDTGVVTIDQNFTTTGITSSSTGDTVRPVACIICRNLDPTPANVALLQWDSTPAASYTWTLDGMCILGAHGGLRIGDSSNRIPTAQKAIVSIKYTTTNGTAGNSGFVDCEMSLGSSTSTTTDTLKMSLFAYGEIPTVQRTTLAADAASGQADIVTTDTTGWSTGDTIFVGRSMTGGTSDTLTVRTGTVSGTTITLSSNLSSIRKQTGSVVRYGGYGVEIKSDSNNNILNYLRGPSNFVLSGVQTYNVQFVLGGSTRTPQDDTANTSLMLVEDGVSWNNTTALSLINSPIANEAGLTIQRWSGVRVSAFITSRHSGTSLNGYSGTFTLDSYWHIGAGNSMAWAGNQKKPVVTNNRWDGHASVYVQFAGISPTITGNTFWGITATASGGAFNFITVSDPTDEGLIENNYIDNCSLGMSFLATAVVSKIKCKTFYFGTYTANTIDIGFIGGETIDLTCENFDFSAGGISETALGDVSAGSQLRVVNYNLSAKDDRVYTPVGKFQRCGDSLTDTTVRTAGTGKYSMRFEPTSSIDNLSWSQQFPTGDIQNQTMTVSCWVKINSATYYAGTHVNPTLSIKYDDTTTVTAVATNTTDWQRLAIPFTPATTYGQITVQVYGSTDATTTDAYFYLDDMDMAYPAGTSLNLGGLDLWANAFPVTPTIATVPSTGSVWDVPTSSLTTDGSTGKALVDTNTAANNAVKGANSRAIPQVSSTYVI